MNLPKAAKNLRLKFHNQVKHYLPKDFVLSNDTTIVTNTIEELNKFTDMNSFNLIESKITKTGKTLSYYYTVKTGNMTLVETGEEIVTFAVISYYQVYKVDDGYTSYTNWQTIVTSYKDGFR